VTGSDRFKSDLSAPSQTIHLSKSDRYAKQRATVDAGARVRIYNHWRRCANGEAGAHRRRQNPAGPANNHDNFSGFIILRGSRQSAHSRRKRLMTVFLVA